MRTTVSDPRGTLSDMDRRERKHRISAYVRERLARECSDRGKQAEIARVTDFTSAHISKVINGAGVGPDFMHALAEYWRTDVAALEAEALKRPVSSPPPASPQPNARATVRSSPEYASASEAVRLEFDSLAADAGMSVVGWARELDRLIELERRGWLPPRSVTAESAPNRGKGHRKAKP